MGPHPLPDPRSRTDAILIPHVELLATIFRGLRVAQAAGDGQQEAEVERLRAKVAPVQLQVHADDR